MFPWLVAERRKAAWWERTSLSSFSQGGKQSRGEELVHTSCLRTRGFDPVVSEPEGISDLSNQLFHNPKNNQPSEVHSCILNSVNYVTEGTESCASIQFSFSPLHLNICAATQWALLHLLYTQTSRALYALIIHTSNLFIHLAIR